MIKLTQELEAGDVIEVADGSIRRIKFIRFFAKDLFAVTYLDLGADEEFFAYEYANSKFTVQGEN
jgi:hypothetical protein